LVGSSLNAAFHGDPPDRHHPWAVHDDRRPQPPRVEPAEILGGAPSDAVILFDGTEASLENWVHVLTEDKRKGNWVVKEGALQCVPGAGYIASKEQFGDCQLHLEWSAPLPVQGNGQRRGNSGVFLMGMVEVQVLDNFNNPTYADGTAGAIYGVMPPAANVLRPPGQWQSYDIIFRRPIVRDGVIVAPGSLTVLLNGVVIQDGTPIEGGGGWRKRQPLDRVFPECGQLKLQDHGNPVRYRNIWMRPLRPRAADGGLDGRLAPEVTLAKRQEIAASIRAEALDLDGLERALRLLESLVYEVDTEARLQADGLIQGYLEQLEGLERADQLLHKEEVMSLARALTYLQDHAIIEDTHDTRPRVQSLIRANGWERKK
jgi:hypothetical protein